LFNPLLNPWLALTFKTLELGFEAQNVIALRMMRLAAGGDRGQNEARCMVTEKFAAGAEAQFAVVSGVLTGRKDRLLQAKSFAACGNGFARTNAAYPGVDTSR
jgi:hypothetical protein